MHLSTSLVRSGLVCAAGSADSTLLLPPALAHHTAQKKVWALQSIPVVSSKEQSG